MTQNITESNIININLDTNVSDITIIVSKNHHKYIYDTNSKINKKYNKTHSDNKYNVYRVNDHHIEIELINSDESIPNIVFNYNEFNELNESTKSTKIKKINLIAYCLNSVDFSNLKDLQKLKISVNATVSQHYGKKIKNIIGYNSKSYLNYGCNCSYDYDNSNDTYKYFGNICRCDTFGQQTYCKCKREEGCICPDIYNCRCKLNCICTNSERCFCSLKCLCYDNDNRKYPFGQIIYSDNDGIIDISNNHELQEFNLVVRSFNNKIKREISEIKLNHDYKIKSASLNNNNNKSFYTKLEKLILDSDYDIDVDIDSFGSSYSQFKYKSSGNLMSAEYLNFADHHLLGKFENLRYFEFDNPAIRHIELPKSLIKLELNNCYNLGKPLSNQWIKYINRSYKQLQKDLKPMLDFETNKYIETIHINNSPSLDNLYLPLNYKVIDFKSNNVFKSISIKNLDTFELIKTNINLAKNIDNLFLDDISWKSIYKYFVNNKINNLHLSNYPETQLVTNDVEIKSLYIKNSNIETITKYSPFYSFLFYDIRCTNLTKLSIIGIYSDINFNNKFFPNLTDLYLENFDEVKLDKSDKFNLIVLKNCFNIQFEKDLDLINLETLEINNKCGFDKLDISKCVNMKKLSLSNIKSNNVKFGQMGKLMELSLSDVDEYDGLLNSFNYCINKLKKLCLFNIDDNNFDIVQYKFDDLEYLNLKNVTILGKSNIELKFSDIKYIDINNVLGIVKIDLLNSPIEHISLCEMNDLVELNNVRNTLNYLKIRNCTKYNYKLMLDEYIGILKVLDVDYPMMYLR